MNFGEDVFFNHPKDIVALATRMRDAGVMPELEVYEAGMLETAYRYAKQGILLEPMHFQFVLGVPGGMSGEPENLLHMIRMLEKLSRQTGMRTPHWGVAGIGRYQLPLAVQAILWGGHVRVGFEDNVFYSKGELAKSNAQLVERVVRLARECGRPVATPEQAREILSLRQG